MKISMFSSKKYDRQFFDAANSSNYHIDYLPVRLSEQTALLAQGSQVVCCFVNDGLNAKALSQLKDVDVRLIALRCTGFNNVDIPAAKKLGLHVCRVPDYSPYAVAEHAVALILDLNRNIHRAHNRIRENDYSLDGLLGFDLHGKTVGVIGGGKIGQAFIRIMQGFGCTLLLADPYLKETQGMNVQSVTMDQLLQNSDVISLHCPLTPETYHVINGDTISKMKRGVMLINTSRGGLIDAAAAIKALKSGHIGYLGIDVYEEEGDLFFEDLSNTFIQDDTFARLQTFPNVTITGHQAFFTKEAVTKIAHTTLHNITQFFAGDLAAANLLTYPSV